MGEISKNEQQNLDRDRLHHIDWGGGLSWGGDPHSLLSLEPVILLLSPASSLRPMDNPESKKTDL